MFPGKYRLSVAFPGVNLAYLPLFDDCLVAMLLTASFASLIVEDVNLFESSPMVSVRESVN